MGGDHRTAKIGKRAVDAATKEATAYRLWDIDLKGFGLKVSPRGVKTYFVWYRVGAGRNAVRREFTIGRDGEAWESAPGRHGTLTPDLARDAAERVLGGVKNGGDPQLLRQKARAELNVSGLCDLYMREGVATKKPLTLKNDGYRIERHIKPLLGRLPVSAVTRADVEKFMQDVGKGKSALAGRPTVAEALAAGWRVKRRKKGDAPGSFAVKTEGLVLPPKARRDFASFVAAGGEVVELRGLRQGLARGGKGAASRAVGLLGAIFNFAVDRKMRADNPVTRVKQFKDGSRQRFLTGVELAGLFTALGALEADGASPMGVTVIRLLALSGARLNEIQALTWAEVDFERCCLTLIDSKTGAKTVYPGAAAMALLDDRPRSNASAFVFPSRHDPEKAYVGAPAVWRKVRAVASLEGVRLHDLRHTFASMGAAHGLSLQMIGALLGHKDASTTKRYAHLADNPVRVAGDRTASAIEAAMSGKSAELIQFASGGR